MLHFFHFTLSQRDFQDKKLTILLFSPDYNLEIGTVFRYVFFLFYQDAIQNLLFAIRCNFNFKRFRRIKQRDGQVILTV